MDSKTFDNSSFRHVTHATTMSEMRNIAKKIEKPRKVLLLPSAAGENCNQASDNEEVHKDFKTAFEPAVELKIEKDIDDEKEDQIGLLT